MTISPATERTLTELARRGLWLIVLEDGRLQPVATRDGAEPLTNELRQQVAAQRAELLAVIPQLELEKVELTDGVVRVLFERLAPGEQQRAFDLRTKADRKKENERFYRDFDNLSRTERVIYLWAYVYGPPANVIQLRRVPA